MNTTERNIATADFFEKCQSLLIHKGVDYCGSGEVWQQFCRIGEVAGVSPAQVLLVYLGKHLEAIRTAILEEQPNSTAVEPLYSRCIDAANYLALIALYASPSPEEIPF